MKIIDAYWEKRNLGVTCKEIIIEREDSVQDLEIFLDSLKNVEYSVIKIYPGNVELLKYLQSNGFYFVETLSEISLDIENYSIPKNFEKLNESIKYKVLPSSQLNTLRLEIEKGIFNTDRIALDSRFGIDIAARRYFNWIQDEVSKGNCVYEILKDEKPIGFFALKQIRNRSYETFLAGMYLDSPNFGFGFSLISKSIEEIRIKNGKYFVTHISSNNLQINRLYAQFGFIPVNTYYVMVKHFN